MIFWMKSMLWCDAVRGCREERCSVLKKSSEFNFPAALKSPRLWLLCLLLRRSGQRGLTWNIQTNKFIKYWRKLIVFSEERLYMKFKSSRVSFFAPPADKGVWYWTGERLMALQLWEGNTQSYKVPRVIHSYNQIFEPEYWKNMNHLI